MNFKKVLSVAFVSALALTACNEEKKAETAQTPAAQPTQKIKVGVMSGPEHTVAEKAAQIAKEKIWFRCRVRFI